MGRLVGLSKENFDDLIQSYCNTLQRNKGKLYEFYKDKTTDMTISFPIRIDEIATMKVNFTKHVYTNEEESFLVMKEEEN